ncbi:MAG TPA: hypothetical protein VHW93_09610, partial [Acidimicrobiales bacterium]|nr:hypothetical protein [Acidimicrobiales bacterium]
MSLRDDRPAPTVPLDPGPRAAPARHRCLVWARTHPGMVIALVVPFAVFGIPLLFGLAYLSGDNLIQNLPMRALVGRDLVHGTLPLWNPYLFSGTPLLGGFNAGAAYPTTWLTAVLPLFPAWTLIVAVAYDVALSGMYVFLRRQALSSPAATYGAVTFAFAGYMTAQIVHVDLITGAAWLPWMLVAVHGLTERRPVDPTGSGRPVARRRRTRVRVLMLAVALGLTLLAGAAESIIDSGVLVLIYGVWRLVSMGHFRRGSRRALVATLGAVGGGLVAGVALGTAQWLPGLVFLSQSQRASTSYTFFTSGSLNSRLLALVASPFALGTNQGWPATYAGTYNFPEVTSYVGILALIAAFSLCLRRWRTRPEWARWRVWYAILAVGVLSSLGGQTPFARLMYLIPGVRSERLLNRNLLLVDMALAVLLAWWVHLILERRPPEGSPSPEPTTVRDRWRDGGRAEVVLTCIPFAFAAIVGVLAWSAAPFLDRLLEIENRFGTGPRLRVAGLVTAQVVVAGVATWIVLVRGRFAVGTLQRLLTAVLVVDLALFNAFVINPPITEASAQANGPGSAALAARTGNGRFIVYDPDRFYNGQLQTLGQTDLNMYHRLPSAQGYTALTDGGYYDATGAHYQEDLDPKTLAGPVWDQLNTTTLLSLPGYFLRPVPDSGRPRIAYPGSAFGRAGMEPETVLGKGQSRTWYFGGVLTVSRWSVPVIEADRADLRVGLVTPTGDDRWLPASDVTVAGSGTQRSLEVTLAQPVAAGGVVVRSGHAGTAVGIPTAETAQAGAVELDGPMQYGVVPPHWVFTGVIGAFGVFRNTRARGWAWVEPRPGTEGRPDGTATARAPGREGNQVITVHAGTGVVLVRSESWSPGWHATIQAVGTGGPARPVA